MEFFLNGFLTSFPDTLFGISGLALNNFAAFAVIAVIALDLSHRLPRYGVTIAILLVLAGALYATGATALLFT